MTLNELEKPLGIALLVAILGMSYLIVQPFLLAIAWGALIAFATWPAHSWLSRKLGSQLLSASIFALVMAVVIIAPLVALGVGIASDGREIIVSIIEMTKTELPSLPNWVGQIPFAGDTILEYWATWQGKGTDWFSDVVPFLQKAGGFFFSRSGILGSVLLQIILAILFAFWFYVEGQQIASTMKQMLNRVIGDAHVHYWKVAAGTIQNVINGIVGTALAQGIVAGIGFWIAGVPAALLLGVLTFMISVIPMAPPLIWIPAVAWLFMQDQTGYAIFLAVWGVVVISGVDNIVKPLLISRGSILPLSIILVGVMGGVLAFGFLGLFIGPVILALFYTLVREWLAQQSATSP